MKVPGEEGEVGLDLVGEEGDLVEVVRRVGLGRHGQVLLLRHDHEVLEAVEHHGEPVEEDLPDGGVEDHLLPVGLLGALGLGPQGLQLLDHLL